MYVPRRAGHAAAHDPSIHFQLDFHVEIDANAPGCEPSDKPSDAAPDEPTILYSLAAYS